MSVREEFLSRIVDWLIDERGLTEDEILNLTPAKLEEYYCEFVNDKFPLIVNV